MDCHVGGLVKHKVLFIFKYDFRVDSNARGFESDCFMLNEIIFAKKKLKKRVEKNLFKIINFFFFREKGVFLIILIKNIYFMILFGLTFFLFI